MSHRWLLAATLVVAGLSAGPLKAQTDLGPSPIASKSHATRATDFASASSAEAYRLESIKVEPVHQGIEFEIQTSGSVTPTLTTIADPNRLVLDFPNTVSAYPGKHIAVDRDGVRSVRIGVQPGRPPVTRVVLDLERPRNYQVVNNGSKLFLKLDDSIAADYPASEGSTPTVVAPAPAKQPVETSTANPVAASDTLSGLKTASRNGDQSPASADLRAANNASVSAPGFQQTQSNPRVKASAAAPVQIASATPPANLAVATNVASNKAAAADDPPADMKPSPVAAQAAPVAPAAAPAPVTAPRVEQSSPAPAQPAPHDVASARADLPATKASINQDAAQTATDQYVIGEQDVLAITVWKEPELSGVVVVRPDGKITVPLVNEVKVVGMTPVQLQDLLTEKLKPFVNVPQVTVTVRQINSRNVYLIGEAAREGSFPINSSTTILQLIAQAGGLRDFAKRKGIYVIRKLGGKQVRYSFNYDEVIRGKNPKQNIVLEPGDLIVVP